jgi:hypothetical protein
LSNITADNTDSLRVTPVPACLPVWDAVFHIFYMASGVHRISPLDPDFAAKG